MIFQVEYMRYQLGIRPSESQSRRKSFIQNEKRERRQKRKKKAPYVIER